MLTQEFERLAQPIKDFANKQHQDAYWLLDAGRNPLTGLYADGFNAGGVNPEGRCSIAATGVGLIGLAVADYAGWDPQALPKAQRTLKAILGGLPGCNPGRDKVTGFFAHFLDMETGENLNSEYSTIDTALLVAGSLFAGKHFSSREPSLERSARLLLESIDWSAVLVPGGEGAVNMVVKNGLGGEPLPPFTEYALVAYLALAAEPENEDFQNLWTQFWAPESLYKSPRSFFRGLEVLAERRGAERGSFLSSFVHQFPFYLVPQYSASPIYRDFYRNACLADRMKWEELDGLPSYVWGYGAGSDEGLHGGYHVNRINHSPKNVASAYIVAGFLPVFPGGIYDLYALYKLHLPYDVSTNTKLSTAFRFGLHRYSWDHLEGTEEEAYPTRVTLVDWSSMLYGLTAFKYGMSFFTERLLGGLLCE